MKVPGFSGIRKTESGLTLLEVTVVITVTLSLIGLSFPGVRAYNNATKRAFCIQNLEAMQKTVQSFGNMYQHNPGDNVPDLINTLIGIDGFFPKVPDCPRNGTYSFLPTIPHEGQQFMSCSITDHVLYNRTESE